MKRGFKGNSRRTGTVAGEGAIAKFKLSAELGFDEVMCQRVAVVDRVDDVEVGLVQVGIIVVSER